MDYYDDYGFRPYVSVGARQAQAARELAKLQKKGRRISPVAIEGRKIARTFWKPGATTSNATATTRIGCRADGPMCATDRWSIYRSGQAASRRSSAARRCTTWR